MKKSEKALGAGVALVAVAAAATYFLAGKRGRANREKIAAWTLKTKAELLEKMKRMKHVDKDTYFSLVDDATVRTRRLGRASSNELKHLAGELRGAWGHISQQLK